MFRTRVWYNPDLKSRNYFLPGVIALIVMLTCLMLTSMAVVQEREMGTMEQLMVTPYQAPRAHARERPYRLPSSASSTCSSSPPWACSGSMCPSRAALLFLSSAPGSTSSPSSGIGLFISTISKTQQQAMMATFFFFQPAILLSGFATPIENMPAGFPVRHLPEPFALLPRDRARGIPEGCRHRCALAAGPRPLRTRDGDPAAERAEVQEEAWVAGTVCYLLAREGSWSGRKAGR